jgi:cytochrome P450
VDRAALAERVAIVIAAETDALPSGLLTWPAFEQAWSRIVHRVLAGHDSPGRLRCAFDAAGIAVFRALAVLATHPGQVAWARENPSGPDLPRLRACVLESARLWPPTPAVLRETTADTTWRGSVLPAGATVVVVTSLFHRDIGTVPDPDTFTPESRVDDRADELVPFSAGPGRDLVLLATSTLLGTLLYRYDIEFDGADRLPSDRPLPGVFDPREQALLLLVRVAA